MARRGLRRLPPFRDYLFRAGVLFSLSFFALAFVIVTYRPPAPKHSQAEYTEAQHQNVQPESFGDRLLDDPTAFFTMALALLTCALAGVSSFQIYFLFSADQSTRLAARAAVRSADAAKQSADVARDTLIANQRAWIKVETPTASHNLRAHNPGLIIDLVLPISNVGNVPAIDIVASAWLDFTWINEKKRNDYAARFDAERIKSDYVSPTIFPKSNVFSNLICRVRMPWADVEPYLIGEGLSGVVVPIIIGCVSYSFPSDPKQRHQTRFAFRFENEGAEGITLDRPKEYRIKTIYPFSAAGTFKAD